MNADACLFQSFFFTPHKVSLALLSGLLIPKPVDFSSLEDVFVQEDAGKRPLNVSEKFSVRSTACKFVIRVHRTTPKHFLEPDFPELVAQLSSIDERAGSLIGEFLERELEALQKSAKALVGFIASLNRLVGDDVRADDVSFGRMSLCGIFFRKCVIACNRLKFDGVARLHSQLKRYTGRYLRYNTPLPFIDIRAYARSQSQALRDFEGELDVPPLLRTATYLCTLAPTVPEAHYFKALAECYSDHTLTADSDLHRAMDILSPLLGKNSSITAAPTAVLALADLRARVQDYDGSWMAALEALHGAQSIAHADPSVLAIVLRVLASLQSRLHFGHASSRMGIHEFISQQSSRPREGDLPFFHADEFGCCAALLRARNALAMISSGDDDQKLAKSCTQRTWEAIREAWIALSIRSRLSETTALARVAAWQAFGNGSLARKRAMSLLSRCESRGFMLAETKTQVYATIARSLAADGEFAKACEWCLNGLNCFRRWKAVHDLEAAALEIACDAAVHFQDFERAYQLARRLVAQCPAREMPMELSSSSLSAAAASSSLSSLPSPDAIGALLRLHRVALRHVGSYTEGYAAVSHLAEICERVSAHRLRCECVCLCADIRLSAGSQRRALPMLERAIAVARQLGAVRLQAQVLLRIGRVYFQENVLDRARSVVMDALALSSLHSDQILTAKLHALWGEVVILSSTSVSDNNQLYEVAVAALRSAETLFARLGPVDELLAVQRVLRSVEEGGFNGPERTRAATHSPPPPAISMKEPRLLQFPLTPQQNRLGLSDEGDRLGEAGEAAHNRMPDSVQKLIAHCWMDAR